jgi:hypothetical protein
LSHRAGIPALPAANVLTTANELSRFFQLLLNEGEIDGIRIFEPATVRRADEPQSGPRFELDGQVILPLRYGLGFMLGSERISLFGSDTARRASEESPRRSRLTELTPGRESVRSSARPCRQ